MRQLTKRLWRDRKFFHCPLEYHVIFLSLIFFCLSPFNEQGLVYFPAVSFSCSFFTSFLPKLFIPSTMKTQINRVDYQGNTENFCNVHKESYFWGCDFYILMGKLNIKLEFLYIEANIRVINFTFLGQNMIW